MVAQVENHTQQPRMEQAPCHQAFACQMFVATTCRHICSRAHLLPRVDAQPLETGRLGSRRRGTRRRSSLCGEEGLQAAVFCTVTGTLLLRRHWRCPRLLWRESGLDGNLCRPGALRAVVQIEVYLVALLGPAAANDLCV